MPFVSVDVIRPGKFQMFSQRVAVSCDVDWIRQVLVVYPLMRGVSQVITEENRQIDAEEHSTALDGSIPVRQKIS